MGCAAQPVPEACPYEYFCKHDSTKQSYYINCDICEGTPICCNTDTITLTTNYPDSGGQRCQLGAEGWANSAMCDQREFPAACSTACSACKKNPSEDCYYDPTCSDTVPSLGGLGCNAAGAGQNCRFCGFGEFADIPC